MAKLLVSTITKQKIATRTIVTVALAALGLLASSASGIYFTQHYQPAYSANYANNQPANNQPYTPPKPTQNLKDLSKYQDREVFLISDKNWRDVLSLVPLTTWTKGKIIHKYPTLIFHEETTGFDADSIIYFMQQYQTKKVTGIGHIPGKLHRLLLTQPDLGPGLDKGQFKRITINDYLSYWQEYKDVVYVEDNYELALMASTYASLINAPLIIKGTSLDAPNVFQQRNVFCVGNASPKGAKCKTRYNLAQLQTAYLKKTRTDKVILVNPDDLNIKVIEHFTLEKSPGSINELYSKTSLAAPILASAKHEIIISTKSTNYQEVDRFIEDKIKNLRINAEYLTIVASPDAIDMVYEKTEMAFNNSSADVWHYSHFDEDLFLDLAVGRILGITISDSSSHMARSIFYEDTLKNEDKILVTRGLPCEDAAARVYVMGKALSTIGYQTTITPSGTKVEDWKDKFLIIYNDHGSTNWAGIPSHQIPYLDNSFVVSDGCSTCAFRKAFSKGNLFCANTIRKGGIGYIGAVDRSGNINTGEFLTEVFAMNEAIGKAFINSKNAVMVYEDFTRNPIARYTFLGDPTLKLKTIHNFSKPQLNFLSGDEKERHHKLVIPAMQFKIPQEIINVMEKEEYSAVPYCFSTSFNLLYFGGHGGETFITRLESIEGFNLKAITYKWNIYKELVKKKQEYLWIMSPRKGKFEEPYYFSEANDYEFTNSEFEITLYSKAPDLIIDNVKLIGRKLEFEIINIGNEEVKLIPEQGAKVCLNTVGNVEDPFAISAYEPYSFDCIENIELSLLSNESKLFSIMIPEIGTYSNFEDYSEFSIGISLIVPDFIQQSYSNDKYHGIIEK